MGFREAVAVGADPTFQLPNGAHPLFGAAMYDKCTVIDTFLALPLADEALDLANERGTTPLMVAAMHGHERAARRLLSAGANAGLRNSSGFTAAEVAEQKGHLELAAYIAGNEVVPQDEIVQGHVVPNEIDQEEPVS